MANFKPRDWKQTEKTKVRAVESVLVTKDLLHMSNIGRSQVPCQYCGNVDHWSSTGTQTEVCPTCETRNHCLNFIFLMLKEAKYQGKDYKGYVVIVRPSAPVISQTGHVYQQIALIVNFHEVGAPMEHNRQY